MKVITLKNDILLEPKLCQFEKLSYAFDLTEF